VLHNLIAEKYPYSFDPGNAGEKNDKIEKGFSREEPFI